MDLKIFFSPIAEDVFSDINDPSSFFKSISVFADRQPAYKGLNIAIIGLPSSACRIRTSRMNPDAILLLMKYEGNCTG